MGFGLDCQSSDEKTVGGPHPLDDGVVGSRFTLLQAEWGLTSWKALSPMMKLEEFGVNR